MDKSSKFQTALGLVIIVAVIVGIVALVSGVISKKSSTPPTTTKTASTSQPNKINDKLNTVLTSLKQKYPSINDSYLISKNRDPDQGFGQSGYYNAGIAFCDSPNTLKEPADSVVAGSASNAYGFACGGVIEIYPDTSGLAKRITYYDNLKTNPELSQCKTISAKEVCDYKAVDDVFLHISDQYPAEQWTPILDFLTEQVKAQNL